MFDFTSQCLANYADQVSYQRLHWSTLDKKHISVYLRRDDLVSSHYPGNKFYKLFYNLKEITEQQVSSVVSFGGAYSNHIHALAAMGKEYGLSTVGVIRGHRPKRLSPTLEDAQKYGMRLLFLNKKNYKEKDLSVWQELLKQEYGNYYLLPEGGENLQGVLGCQEIGRAIARNFTGDYTVCCAVGTGTTLSGIISGLPEYIPCLGFSALKGDDTLSDVVNTYLQKLQCSHNQWQILNNCHHGGYAKVSPELMSFMKQLEEDNQLLLEPVYTAKMLWGIEQLALEGFFKENSKIIAVHGGGLQGRRGFIEL